MKPRQNSYRGLHRLTTLLDSVGGILHTLFCILRDPPLPETDRLERVNGVTIAEKLRFFGRQRMQRWQHGFATLSAVMLALVAELTVAAHGMAAASEPVLAVSGDVRALVAPVALYPDPILAVVLQASTLPLQVVQADRFLTRREKDKTLAPDPDWDKSIIALLNYPRQVRLMSEYIDWTEELGDRVVDDLDAVQAAIQDVRLAAYDAGFLKSDKHQTVEVKDDQVRIISTDPKTVTIPRYDPAALLTALDEIEEADEMAEEVVTAPASAAAAPKEAAAPAGQPAPPAAHPATAPPPETPAA